MCYPRSRELSPERRQRDVQNYASSKLQQYMRRSNKSNSIQLLFRNLAFVLRLSKPCVILHIISQLLAHIFRVFSMKLFPIQRVALFACAVMALISCNKSNNSIQDQTAGAKPEKGDWIIIHQLSDPEGLNPITTSDAGARNVFSKIFEPLLDVDYATSELTPNIAAALPTLSPDHLTYTFTLKKNVTFSDGKPLTSKDVIFTLKAVKNPLLIDGAALRNYYESLVDVTAPDDYTVIMTLNKPYFIADAVLGNNVPIFPKHIFDPKNLTDNFTFAETNSLEKAQANAAMKEFAEWFGAAERKRDVNTMVGSGPYILEEWRTGESIRLKRNDKYWNGSNNPNMVAYPDKLVFKTVNDRNTALTTMKNGDLDFIEYMPPKRNNSFTI